MIDWLRNTIYYLIDVKCLLPIQILITILIISEMINLIFFILSGKFSTLRVIGDILNQTDRFSGIIDEVMEKINGMEDYQNIVNDKHTDLLIDLTFKDNFEKKVDLELNEIMRFTNDYELADFLILIKREYMSILFNNIISKGIINYTIIEYKEHFQIFKHRVNTICKHLFGETFALLNNKNSEKIDEEYLCAINEIIERKVNSKSRSSLNQLLAHIGRDFHRIHRFYDKNFHLIKEYKVNSIEDLTKNGNFAAVFYKLLFGFGDKIDNSLIIALQSRYNKNENDLLKGIISKDEYNLEHNRIREGIYYILKLIKNEI